MLRKLDWDIETAYQAGLAGKVLDVNLLKYARGNNRIYLTFDELRGQHGRDIGRELRKYGGNMVQIRGGDDEDKYHIIGKLLFYYPDWYPFQIKHDGVSVISDLKKNCVNYTPEGWHQKFHKVDAAQFAEYLKKQKLKPYKRRPRRRVSSPDQQMLM